VKGSQGRSGARAVPPRVLEPALADFRVGPAGDPALGLEPAPRVADLAQVAIVAEREPLAGIDEWLRVGELEGGQLRGSPQVDQRARRRDGADPRREGVIAKRPDVAVAPEAAVLPEPSRAPAEAGHAVALEAIRERPELVEPERLCGPGDEVLAHRRR
jgi:hypothetical protein